MAYKKYIHRGGKTFGPYYYESYRDETGKVRKKYMGTEDPAAKKNNHFAFHVQGNVKSPRKKRKFVTPTSKKLLLFSLGILFLLAILVFFAVPKGMTGGVILEYMPEQNPGMIFLSLDQGEFLPASTNLIIETSNRTFQYNVDDFVDEESVEGNYSISGTTISGQGLGYGEEEILIDVSDLGLDLNEAKVSFIYDGEEIASIILKVVVEPVQNATEVVQNESLEVVVNETVLIQNDTISEQNITEIIEEETVQNETVQNETIPEEVNNETASEQGSVELVENQTTTETPLPEQDTQNIAGAIVQTIQYNATINNPVKWKKIVQLENESVVKVELPKEGENVTVYKIEKVSGEETKTGLDIENKEEVDENKVKITITGNVVLEGEGSAGILSRILGAITGRVVSMGEVEGNLEVIIDTLNDSYGASEYEIEYETPAPLAFENDIEEGKEIVISSEFHYENVLAYTELSPEAREEEIRLYHVQNDSRILTDFQAYDLNGNDLIDYIEWIVPHLSNQTYILATESVTDDAFVRQDNPTTNYGTGDYLWVGESAGNYVGSLIKLTNSLENDSAIDWAIFKLYYADFLLNSSNPINLSIRRITSDWDDSTVTWNTRPSYTSDMSINTSLTDNYGWVEFDVSEIVQGWVNESYDNYGLAVVPNTEPADTVKMFYSQDYANSKFHPILEVNYPRAQFNTLRFIDPMPISNAEYQTINDSNVYFSAYPETIYRSQYAYFELVSKRFEGEIDIIWGFDAETTRPTSADLYQPHFVPYNVTHSTVLYNVTSDMPATQDCDIGHEYNRIRRDVVYSEGEATVCFDSYSNINNDYTITWNSQRFRLEEWLDITDRFETIEYEYDNKTHWYLLKNVNVNANQTYKLRTFVETSGVGKYDFAMKPSSETIAEAIAAGHFYFLDPQWQTTDNTGFDLGTYLRTMWNSTQNALTLDYNGTALPNAQADETSANMSGNVLLMHFDNDSSVGENDTHVYDWSGGGNNGTVTGDPTAVSGGRIGGGFEFDGEGDYIDLGDKATLEDFDNITISSWIKIPETPSGAQFIVGKEDDYKIDVRNTRVIRFLSGENWGGSILTSATTVPVGKWIHLVAVYNGTDKSLYFNAIQDPNIVSTSGNVENSSRKATIGARDDGGGGI